MRVVEPGRSTLDRRRQPGMSSQAASPRPKLNCNELRVLVGPGDTDVDPSVWSGSSTLRVLTSCRQASITTPESAWSVPGAAPPADRREGTAAQLHTACSRTAAEEGRGIGPREGTRAGFGRCRRRLIGRPQAEVSQFLLVRAGPLTKSARSWPARRPATGAGLGLRLETAADRASRRCRRPARRCFWGSTPAGRG